MALMVGIVGWLTGCASDPNPKSRYEFPFGGPGESTPAGSRAQAPGQDSVSTATNSLPGAENFSRLRVGDLIIISFSDLVSPPPRQEIHIPDTGIITLPYNVQVKAAGKTTTELEREIREAYVPNIFVNLTITVRTDLRSFYVDGEVKQPGRHNYTGVMTLLRAIGTAGGFTDFANRKNIELRRQNGQKFVINYKEALNSPNSDIPVYPNDFILVRRRSF